MLFTILKYVGTAGLYASVAVGMTGVLLVFVGLFFRRDPNRGASLDFGAIAWRLRSVATWLFFGSAFFYFVGSLGSR